MSKTTSDLRTVRIGIIGTGSIARSSHLPAYQAMAGAELVAVCDVSREAVEAAGDRFGVPHRYTDWRALLDRSDVDAVDICTPNQVRLEPTLAACAAGKHVLVQKPMARSIEEATAMIEAARRHHVKLGVIYMGRFNPGNALTKRLIDAGVIGRVTAMRVRTGHSGGLRLPETSWRRSFENVAGSWSLLAVHSADRLRWFGGPMTRIAAIGKTLVSRMEGDDNFGAVAEFASGVLATMESCYNMIPSNGLFEAYGDKGTIMSSGVDRTYRCQATGADEFPWAEHLNGLTPVQDEAGWWTFRSEQARDAGLLPFRDYFTHWVDCVRHDRTPVTIGEEGRASLEIILAGYESAATRQFVDLEWQTW